MFLSADNQKNFAFRLSQEINKAVSFKEFSDKIDSIRYLNKISLTKFKLKDDTLASTYNNRRFKIKPIVIEDVYIDQITNIEDYGSMISVGIETIIRSIFSDGLTREFISEIINGDEMLKLAIKRGFYQRGTEEERDTPRELKWLNNSDPKLCMGAFTLLPFKALEDGIKVTVLPHVAYLQFINDLCLIVLTLSDNFRVPLGEYEITSDDQNDDALLEEILACDSEGCSDDEPVFLPYSYSLTPNSWSSWEDQYFKELLYNSTVGIVYKMDMDLFEMIEEEVHDNNSNRMILDRVLTLLTTSVGESKLDSEILKMIHEILYSLKLSLDKEICNGRWSGRVKITNRIFSMILPELDGNTLFFMAADEEILVVVDEFGIEKTNVLQYILKDQVRRYSLTEEYDMTVRDMINNKTFEDEGKEVLLSLIFNK